MKKVLIILSLVVLSLVLVSCGSTGNAVYTASDCSDSDGGQAHNVAGTTKSRSGSFTDVCKDSRTLLENFCRDGKRITETVPCLRGCSAGACKPLLK